MASEKTKLLVDCGLVAKEIERRLGQLDVDPTELDGILITHAHTDHFRAAGTMQARHGITVYTKKATLQAIRDYGNQGSFGRVKKCCEVPRRLGDIEVRTFRVPHYSFWRSTGEPVGYVLRRGRKKIGIATDLGEVRANVIKALRGCDALVFEANYHEPIMERKLGDWKFASDWGYLKWVKSRSGHLSNLQCARALSEIITEKTCHVFLAHMSDNHLYPEKDNNKFRYAKEVVEKVLKDHGVPTPELLKTYRRDRTEGKKSERIIL